MPDQHINHDPKGLLLNLKKRKFRLRTDDTNQFDYLLYGNFDGMSIRLARDWYDLAPRVDMDNDAFDIKGKDSFLEIPYVSTFVLKLLFPQELPTLEKIGYDYSKWNNEDEIKSLSEDPFFSMVMISISDDLAVHFHDHSKSKNSSKDLLMWLSESIHGLGEEFSDLGIFETLGYYDYVLLLHSSSLDRISKFCSGIRMLSVPENDSCSAISTCYTVLGIKNWTRERSEDIPNKYNDCFQSMGQEIQAIDIEFQLHGGKSITPLQDRLKDKGIRSIQRLSHGSTDVILSFSGDQFSKIIPEYFQAGFLNPGNSMYNETVVTKKTSFNFKDQKDQLYKPLGNSDPSFDLKQHEIFTHHFQELYRTLNELEKLRKDCKRNQRQTTSLRQTVSNYSMVISSRHAFEFRYFLQPIFDFLRKNMNYTNDHIKKRKYLFEYFGEKLNLLDIKSNQWLLELYQESLEEYQHFWNEYEKALESFRDSVGNFLSDTVLSDKYFFEDSQLKHPPIGSAAKLIFFYNMYVNQLAEKINNDSEHSYCFLVTSGGNNDISVLDIFNFIPIEEQNDCLLIIELPERVLYNVPVALKSITHEMFHIIGKRDRRYRCQKVEDAAIETIGSYLNKITFDDKKIKDGIMRSTTLRQYDDFLTEVFDKGKKTLSLNVQEWFNGSRLSNKMGSQIPKDYFYQRNIKQELKNYFYESMMDLKCPTSGKRILRSAFFCYIYDEICELLSAALEEYSQKDKINLMFWNIQAKKFRELTKLNSNDENINYVLDTQLYIDLGKYISFLGNGKTFLNNNQGVFQNQLPIDIIIEDCFEAMYESFADCMMIKLWDVPIQEYLLWFFFADEGAVDDVIRINTSTVLRIYTTVKVSYRKSCLQEVPLKFDDCEKQYLIEMIQKYNESKSLIYNLDSQEVISHFETLFQECENSYHSRGILPHITEYLETELSDRELSTTGGLLPFQKAYDAWNNGNFSHNDILDQWIEIAKREKDKEQ